MPTRTVVAIGDTHFPFHDSTALRRAIAITKEAYELNPKNTTIVQLGDLFDAYSFAKFPRSHNVMTPKDEMYKARDLAENFWKDIKKLCPKAECYQLMGNHDARPYKRIIEHLPQVEGFLTFKGLYEFPGVDTIHDPRDELIIDSVLYTHGFMGGVGRHLNYFQRSVVFGHLHLGFVHFQRRKDLTLFEMNAGFLASPKSVALSYTPTKFSKWTPGLGIIDQYGPRFVPL